jgi:hypothetical protein
MSKKQTQIKPIFVAQPPSAVIYFQNKPKIGARRRPVPKGEPSDIKMQNKPNLNNFLIYVMGCRRGLNNNGMQG